MKINHIKLGSICLALMFSITFVQAKQVEQHNSGYTSPGKPSAPIQIDFQPISKPISVGDTITIGLQFQIQKTDKNLAVAIKPRHENQISLNKINQQRVVMKSDTDSEPMPIKFTAIQEGINYIDVIASIDSDTGKQFKTLSIPVIVGKPNWEEYLKPQGELKTDASGQKIIALPATETIR